MHRSTYRCVYVSIRRHKKPKNILHICIYAFIYMHIRTNIYRLLLHQKEFLLVSKHLHEIQYIHFALLNWCCYIKCFQSIVSANAEYLLKLSPVQSLLVIIPPSTAEPTKQQFIPSLLV